MNDFTDVYNEYAEPVRRFLQSLTQNEELAAELTQETVKEDFQYGKLEDGKFYYTNESTKIPEENIDEWLRDRNEYYNKNKDLTYEQFYAIKKSNFISQLQQWRKNGYKISAFGWDSAYENGDEINNIGFNVICPGSRRNNKDRRNKPRWKQQRKIYCRWRFLFNWRCEERTPNSQ